MRRPYRVTLTCLYDDGLRSKLAYRKSWTFSTFEKCEEKKKEIRDLNFPQHYSGIVMSVVHAGIVEDTVIRKVWYL